MDTRGEGPCEQPRPARIPTTPVALQEDTVPHPLPQALGSGYQ